MTGFVKNVLTLVASVIVFALVVELVLRLSGIAYPIFSRSDDDLGWSFRPDTAGYSVHESVAWVRINRHGFRGPDWTTEKPDGTYRVAFLGDSFVEASNVAFQDSVGEALRRELGECSVLADRSVEVLNFGVSGYGTDQAFLLLDTVFRFNPDAVLLGFFIGNDLNNNHAALAPRSQHLKPFFSIAADGTLLRDDSFRDDPEFSEAWWRTRVLGEAINRSALLQLIKQALLTGVRLPDEGTDQGVAFDPDAEPGGSINPQEPKVYAPPSDSDWSEAWSVSEALLAAVSERVRAANLPFSVAVIPDPAELDPDVRSREANADEHGYDFSYPARRLVDFGEANGIDVLNLADPFGREVEKSGAYLYGWLPKIGKGHLNEAGNRLAGSAVATWTCDGLTKSVPPPT